MEEVLKKHIIGHIRDLNLRDKLTPFLAKKEKIGTFQSFEKSKEIEEEVINNVVDYLNNWLFTEFTEGSLKEKMTNEILGAVHLELARIGCDGIFNK